MCAIWLRASRFGLGWAHDAITFACHMFMHFPCIHTSFQYIWYIWKCLDFSDCLSFSLSLLFTLVVFMAHMRKSTLARNPLHSNASSSSNPTLSHIQFCDDDAFKAFSENFSRRGIHSERKVILSDFVDTGLPSVIHNRGWESLCNARSPVLSCWSRSSTPTCTGLIGQYLFSSLAFEVRAFLSHRN